MHKNKGFAEDLDEKKLSYVIIKFLEKNKNNTKFNNLFKKSKKNYNDKKEIIDILNNEIKNTYNFIKKLEGKIKNEIKSNNLNILFDNFLNGFVINKNLVIINKSKNRNNINLLARISRKHVLVANILSFIVFTYINKNIFPNIIIF